MEDVGMLGIALRDGWLGRWGTTGGVRRVVLLAKGGSYIAKNLPSYIVELLAVDEVTRFLEGHF